ncbi:uncharacterized protein JCM6883_000120 [Sporobolomyces salmoneus]|uniref:uncharacterized protein n=1 Tax=Sporobolomyces salmoneus TaxID=183962 RepID=UPI003180CC0A
MPTELLPFPPSYVVVGAYRLCTDRNLYEPIWTRSRQSLKRAALFCIPLLLLSFPLTRLYVVYILSRSPFSPKNIHDAQLLGVSPVQYTTWMLVLGQVTFIVEWMLKRELKKSRTEVYDRTVQSRGKPTEFWQPYVEEWKVPPFDRAKRSAERQSFYKKLASPIFRMLVLRVLLTPLSFIPGLALCVMSSIRALTLARTLHEPYFKSKRMTPSEVELWMVERQKEYRMFGFCAALAERIPLFGLIFSISNRIGAAMYAHDLEKRQHEFSSGTRTATKVYESKTARIADMQAQSGIPEEVVHGVGGYPSRKQAVKILKDGTEIGKPMNQPPSLPPR